MLRLVDDMKEDIAELLTTTLLTILTGKTIKKMITNAKDISVNIVEKMFKGGQK